MTHILMEEFRTINAGGSVRSSFFLRLNTQLHGSFDSIQISVGEVTTITLEENNFQSCSQDECKPECIKDKDLEDNSKDSSNQRKSYVIEYQKAHKKMLEEYKELQVMVVVIVVFVVFFRIIIALL